MHHYRAAIGVGLILFVAALPANAQERTGFAAHAGLGVSVIQDRDGAEEFDGNGIGYSFGLEYRFVPRFALGIDVFNLGSASDTVGSVDTEIEAAGFDMFARLIFPVSDALEVYGRVGSVIYNADVTPGLSTALFGEDGASYGAGLDIGRDKFSFRLEGRYIDGSRQESGALLSVGLSYRF